MPLTAVPLVPLLRSAVRTAVLAVAPAGGQGAARRNAWSAMATDTARARARREAAAALEAAALTRAGVRASG